MGKERGVGRGRESGEERSGEKDGVGGRVEVERVERRVVGVKYGGEWGEDRRGVQWSEAGRVERSGVRVNENDVIKVI